MIPALFRYALSALVLAAAATIEGGAAGQDPLHNPGLWEPSSFDSPYGAAWGLSRAEINAIYGRLGAVTEVLKQSPVLKSPVGFQVRVYHTAGGTTGAPRDARQRFPSSRISVFLFKYLRECPTCAIEPEVESSGHVYLTFNNLDELFPLPQRPFAVDHEGPIYVGAAHGGYCGRFPIYQSPGKGLKFVLTNRNSGPLWLPVSQERYINARVAAARKVLDGYAARGRQNPYQSALIGRLETELSGLSAAERGAPAYVGGRTTRPSGLASDARNGGQALVAPNPAYYDLQRPRTSLQVAVVSTYPAILNPSVFMGRTVQSVVDSVDWEAVARLLD